MFLDLADNHVRQARLKIFLRDVHDCLINTNYSLTFVNHDGKRLSSRETESLVTGGVSSMLYNANLERCEVNQDKCWAD